MATTRIGKSKTEAINSSPNSQQPHRAEKNPPPKNGGTRGTRRRRHHSALSKLHMQTGIANIHFAQTEMVMPKEMGWVVDIIECLLVTYSVSK